MNNDNKLHQRFLPIWLWIIVLAQIVLVLLFSIGTALDPSGFIPGATELDYAIQLYVTRNVTVAVGIIVALLLKSHKALLVMFIVRLLTDLSDIVSVYALDADPIRESVPVVVVLLVIPALLAIGYLWSRAKSAS